MVVGFGNTMRGDDALGALVVELVTQKIALSSGDRRWRDIVLRQVHQPDVTLAAELAGFQRVVFVDATQPEPVGGFSWELIRPGLDSSFASHVCSLPTILSIAGAVYGSGLTGYLLAVGGHDFTLAAGISTPARRNAEKAADFLLGFFQQLS